MSNTTIQEPSARDLSSGSCQTLLSRPLQPISDPSASKRVCFYRSGDYKFGGHRMVINGRTFKTFDSLLDTLSKKVPLPFGVRTITTPRGTHLVKTLDDLHDGGSFVCSDQKRVKPLNLDEVNRRQVPWNTNRLFSAGPRNRHRLTTNRPAKVTERLAVRTPKKLVVISNRNPSVKRTIVLQRRTAPTFDALLDYLSQILLFPVLKLFSIDSSRVDGLAALILCSGVVVAAGNEPFRLGNYSFQKTKATEIETVEPSMVQPRAQTNKSFSNGRASKNFSFSSERYIVDQLNRSRNGSMNGQLHHQTRSSETEVKYQHSSTGTCGSGRVSNELHAFIVPREDDIEKSFWVNQDGSMTVEMKVHLTIKEEEMLHWTTTLNRSSLNKRTSCASISESGHSSSDSNDGIAKDSASISGEEMKEENDPTRTGEGVTFKKEQVYEGYTSMALKKEKASFKRTQTPGPLHVSKKASVESVRTVTESGGQESTLGHFSYMERTVDVKTSEGYHIIRHSSSSSRPTPKPNKTVSAEKKKKGSHSSVRSSGVAEVLQIQNNGMEVRETVMHIYESKGCYDNYFANEDYSTYTIPLHDSIPAPESNPSTDLGLSSSSNECDVDFSTTDSLQRQKGEMLSLSSEPVTLRHDTTENLSSVAENEARSETNSQLQRITKKSKTPKNERKKKMVNPSTNNKSSKLTSSSYKKKKESIKSHNKSLSSSESAKSGHNSGRLEKTQIKTMKKDEKNRRKEQDTLANTGNVKRAAPQKQNMNKIVPNDKGHNINSPTRRTQMKKNMGDILQPPQKSLVPGKRTTSKPKSRIENRISSPKKSSETCENLIKPSPNPSHTEVHQYVESWLEKVSSDPAPYTEEAIADESQPHKKIMFQIGGDSESDEKNECRKNVEHYQSAPCLLLLCHTEPFPALLPNKQYVRGFCASVPSVRADSVPQENRLRAHKPESAIIPADNELSPSTSNVLSSKAKIKPVLQKLCSSMQSIRRDKPNLEKSNSLPDFPTQVASVFGSSCKAFLSFLSVMTLRDHLTGKQSRNISEAMLMMESLKKISAMEDEKEQRESLIDLKNRASSQFRECWKDFLILREKLDSKPLSLKVSETELALDVVSGVSDAVEDQHLFINELMEELNMPKELRQEISLTNQQAKGFYPVLESIFVHTERNQSDSEEDVEKCVDEYEDETKQSSEPDTTCTAEDIAHTNQGDNDKEQSTMVTQSEKTTDKFHETGIDFPETDKLQTKKDTPLKDIEERQEVDVEDREEGRTTDKEELVVGEKEEERDEGIMDEGHQETREDDSFEETDEREGFEETEAGEEAEEEESDDEGGTEVRKGEDIQEETDEDIKERNSRGEVDKIPEEEGDEEEEELEVTGVFAEAEAEADHVKEEKEQKEITDVTGWNHEEAETENIVEEIEDKEEEEDINIKNTDDEVIEEDEREIEEEVTEEDIEEDAEEEDEVKGKHMVSEENSTVGEWSEQNQLEDGENVEVRNIDRRVFTDEEEEEQATDSNSEEEEKCDEVEEERFVRENKVLEEIEIGENKENVTNDLKEGFDQVEVQESMDEEEELNVSDDFDSFDRDCKMASYLQQNSQEKEANIPTERAEYDTESPNKYSSEEQCEDDEGNRADSVHELEADMIEARHKEISQSLQHPVEISQELLDFVNSALQSSSLIFTYDAQGNVRIEPENARVIQSKQTTTPIGRDDRLHNLKRLPSPSTSDLSDYRPETSESGGYETQDSVDIVTDSEEDTSTKPSPIYRRKTDSPHRRKNDEHANYELCGASNSGVMQHFRLQSEGSVSSFNSDTKASKEDLSYFSSASSHKGEPAREPTQCISLASEKDSADGVLIDQGRWLLKENHLIRNSPPVFLGMYGNVDSSSIDTSQENPGEDSPSQAKTQQNPLTAISSSDLEEMAKPPTPKCNYYNMPHGSDSDPFMDDSSLKNGTTEISSDKGRGVRVSPLIDTSKTWANKNGSLSSFTSVDFKMQDRKVHPEGESSAVTQARRTSCGRERGLQAQDSVDHLRVRCGQYCPIL